MAANKKTLTVTQTGSPIGRRADQRATLAGLGLNKMRRRRELEDTPAVRGMIAKVSHLVRIEERRAPLFPAARRETAGAQDDDVDDTE